MASVFVKWIVQSNKLPEHNRKADPDSEWTEGAEAKQSAGLSLQQS